MNEGTKKPVVIILAAILYAIFGVISVIGGIALVSSGQAIASNPFVMGYMNPVKIILLGACGIVLGSLSMVAAYGLSKLQKWGGMLAIGIVVFSLLFSAIIDEIGSKTFAIDFAIDFVLIGMVILGWRSLK
jgi:hypothetical protein